MSGSTTIESIPDGECEIDLLMRIINQVNRTKFDLSTASLYFGSMKALCSPTEACRRALQYIVEKS